jgi:hypothetical protein
MQYDHLANLQRLIRENQELAAILDGNYLVTPDITVGR